MFCGHLAGVVFPSLPWCLLFHCWWRCTPSQNCLVLYNQAINNINKVEFYQSWLLSAKKIWQVWILCEFCPLTLSGQELYLQGKQIWLMLNLKMHWPIIFCSLLFSSLWSSSFCMLSFTLSDQGRFALTRQHNIKWKINNCYDDDFTCTCTLR